MWLRGSLIFYVFLGVIRHGICYAFKGNPSLLGRHPPVDNPFSKTKDGSHFGRQGVGTDLRYSPDDITAPEQAYEDDDYIKSSINLPLTLWPKGKNFTRSSLERQIRIQKLWKDNDIYRRLLERRLSTLVSNNFTDAKITRFTRVILDGPPYANGDAHYGHFLNKTIKDVLLKAALLEGKLPLFLPGWDCHGIPIESKVLNATEYNIGDIKNAITETGSTRAVEVRQRCSQVAFRSIQSQTKSFERAGIWGFWEDFYATYHFYYEKKVMDAFNDLYDRKLIYRARCPQHYSSMSKSVLADSEIVTEERDILTAVVAFQLMDPTPVLESIAFHRPLVAVKLACWTTLPWTIPGNRGLLISGDTEYDVFYRDGVLYVMNNEGIGVFTSDQHVGKVKGEALVNCSILNPITGAEYKVHDYRGLVDNKGTGIVHSAPAHGILDFRVLSSQDNLTISDTFSKDANVICNIIDEEERFYEGIHVLLDGLSIHDLDSKKLSTIMGADLLQHRTLRLPVDLDWRYGNRTHVRITKQWCLSLSERKASLDKLGNVKFYPEASRNYLTNIVKHRPQDWCISRQRIWGTPIPVSFVNAEALNNEELSKLCNMNQRNEGIFTGEYKLSVNIDSLPNYELGDRVFRKLQYQTDTVDVWFESALAQQITIERLKEILKGLARKLGVSNSVTFRDLVPEYAVEGQDQFRGWYQSSLLVNSLLGGNSPAFARKVITHGFVNDDSGNKLSKRNQGALPREETTGERLDQANIVDHGKEPKSQNAPESKGKITRDASIRGDTLMDMIGSEYYDDPELIELDNPKAVGADVLRLWVCSNDFLQKDIQLNSANISEARDFARKVANFFKYTIGVTHDCKVKNDRCRLKVSNYNALDIFFLKLSYDLVREARQYIREGKFYKVVRSLEVFLTKFSNIYITYCKDALYCDVKHGVKRTAVQIIIKKIMRNVLGVVAPLMPHMAEDVFHTISQSQGPTTHNKRDSNHVRSVFGERWRKVPVYLERINVDGVDLALQLRAKVNCLNIKTDDREMIIVCDGEYDLRKILQLETKYKLDLRLLFNVAEVKLKLAPYAHQSEDAISFDMGTYKIYLLASPFDKCRRCWLFRDHLCSGLCERCSNTCAKVLHDVDTTETEDNVEDITYTEDGTFDANGSDAEEYTRGSPFFEETEEEHMEYDDENDDIDTDVVNPKGLQHGNAKVPNIEKPVLPSQVPLDPMLFK